MNRDSFLLTLNKKKCAKGLSSLLRDAEGQNLIQGVKVYLGDPTISHLFFCG